MAPQLCLPFVLAVSLASGQYLDLAPFARPCCTQDDHSRQTLFDYGHPAGVNRDGHGRWIYGLQWAEERDVREVAVRTAMPSSLQQARVEYWSHTWPPRPPEMPSTEDPADDPWQGTWLTARTSTSCREGSCRLTFEPLGPEENARAKNLPGVRYRRTLKVRLILPQGPKPDIQAVQVFSETTTKKILLRIRFDSTPAAAPVFEAYNGAVGPAQADAAGWLLPVELAQPKPAGSNDITVISVKSGGKTFSFAPADAARGPMVLPDFGAIITTADTPAVSAKAVVKPGAKIRERLAREPEQSYERATRDIPPLDPVDRQWGGRLYVPLAADASWQKFAVEWGGNIMISKDALRVKEPEARLLTWPQDRIAWRIGTGAEPDFREKTSSASLSLLETSGRLRSRDGHRTASNMRRRRSQHCSKGRSRRTIRRATSTPLRYWP